MRNLYFIIFSCNSNNGENTFALRSENKMEKADYEKLSKLPSTDGSFSNLKEELEWYKNANTGKKEILIHALDALEKVEIVLGKKDFSSVYNHGSPLCDTIQYENPVKVVSKGDCIKSLEYLKYFDNLDSIYSILEKNNSTAFYCDQLNILD